MSDSLQHKFDEHLQIVLKADVGDMLPVFQKMASELGREGSEYSINRESVVKFFNELDGHQQKEFLALLVSEQKRGRSVYDVASDYQLKLFQGRH